MKCIYKCLYEIWSIYLVAFLLSGMIFFQTTVNDIMETYSSFCTLDILIVLFLAFGVMLVERIHRFFHTKLIQIRFRSKIIHQQSLIFHTGIFLLLFCLVHRLPTIIFSFLYGIPLVNEVFCVLSEFLLLADLAAVYLFFYPQIQKQILQKNLYLLMIVAIVLYFSIFAEHFLNLEEILYFYLARLPEASSLLIIFVMVSLPLFLYRLQTTERCLFKNNIFNGSLIFLLFLALCKTRIFPPFTYDQLSMYLHDQLFSVKFGEEINLVLLTAALFPVLLILLKMSADDEKFEEIKIYLLFRFTQAQSYSRMKRLSVLCSGGILFAAYCFAIAVFGYFTAQDISITLQAQFINEVILMWIGIVLSYDTVNLFVLLGMERHFALTIVFSIICLLVYGWLKMDIHISLTILFIVVWVVSEFLNWFNSRLIMKKRGSFYGH